MHCAIVSITIFFCFLLDVLSVATSVSVSDTIVLAFVSFFIPYLAHFTLCLLETFALNSYWCLCNFRGYSLKGKDISGVQEDGETID